LIEMTETFLFYLRITLLCASEGFRFEEYCLSIDLTSYDSILIICCATEKIDWIQQVS